MSHIDSFPIGQGLIDFRDTESLREHLSSVEGLSCSVIGRSREGRDLFGVRIGTGALNVSVIAGCHADEPIGPMTAQALPILLQESFPELLEKYTFHIVPQMNPDGAHRNRPWFSDPPLLSSYLTHTVRELPGEDIEFGFGSGEDVRPECRAAQEFLNSSAPFAAHFSLHGMAFAEGLWCLIEPEWAERMRGFMDELTEVSRGLGVPLHDVERNGEKGFCRLREGFSTTPNSKAMKAFFIERDDQTMADLFMPNSMEWIRGLGGDPLCIVSELPLFLIGKRSPSLLEPTSVALKEALEGVRARGSEGLDAGAEEVSGAFELRTMPIALQMRLQMAIIVLALKHLG